MYISIGTTFCQQFKNFKKKIEIKIHENNENQDVSILSFVLPIFTGTNPDPNFYSVSISIDSGIQIWKCFKRSTCNLRPSAQCSDCQNTDLQAFNCGSKRFHLTPKPLFVRA